MAEVQLNNLTPRAQQVLAHARNEALRLKHDTIRSEHILFGLCALGQGVATNILKKNGVTVERLQAELETIVTGPHTSSQKPGENILYAASIRELMVLASKEAATLNHTYVGTEHLLLGLLQQRDDAFSNLLSSLKLNAERMRTEILRELDPNFAIRAHTDSINTGLRYDVYCSERNQEVVYQGVLFKGVKRLFPHNQYDVASQFVELEYEDGRRLFVSRSCILKFIQSK